LAKWSEGKGDTIAEQKGEVSYYKNKKEQKMVESVTF
jgi:hypothetical protein